MEKFTDFNLEIALQKPHLVRHKRHAHFRCVKVERSGNSTGVSWGSERQAVKWWYTENAEANYLHLLVEEPKQAETSNVVEYEGKMYNKVPFIEDYYAPDILCFSSTDNVKVKTITERMGGFADVVFYDEEELYVPKAELKDHIYILLPVSPEQTAKVNTEQAVSLEPEQFESVLQEAERLIVGQRAADYGSAFDGFTNIAKMWSVIMGVEVTAVQVAHAMIALKLCRSTNSKGVKRDDWVDICGYAQLGYNIANQIKADEDGSKNS